MKKDGGEFHTASEGYYNNFKAKPEFKITEFSMIKLKRIKSGNLHWMWSSFKTEYVT